MAAKRSANSDKLVMVAVQKMTGENPEVRSDKRRREEREEEKRKKEKKE